MLLFHFFLPASPATHHHLSSFPSSPNSPALLRLPYPHPFPSLHRSPRLRSSTSLLKCPCFQSLSSCFDEELDRLLVLLPDEMRRKVDDHPELSLLIEIVMDLGRRPLARFPSGDFILSDRPITPQDLHQATSQVGDFSKDNRAGISRTLHRISAIRNRKGVIIGLTCRVGRAVTGSANLLIDLVKDGGSLLLIGPPGVGKTTIIREIARMLADNYRKRVMIVDTSNEIGGDGDIPHSGIGNARRLQVSNSDMQHMVLIEAVENHMPQVIVIDEIGTRLEAMAASTIAQRGIQLVATAHGVTIENLIMNPSLEMLVGGIQSVTLGDEEASRRGVQKTILERKGPSTFTCGAEIISKTEIRVHRSLESTVDALLAGRSPNFEVRKINPDGSTQEMLANQIESDNSPHKETKISVDNLLKYNEEKNSDGVLESKPEEAEGYHPTDMDICLYIYGISETIVLQAINQLGMDEIIQLTDNISEADAFLALHAKMKKNSQLQAAAKSHGIPIYVTKMSSLVQVTKAIRALTSELTSGQKDLKAEENMSSSEKADALEEVRWAVEHIVIPRGENVQLLPRPSQIISVQIDLIENYKLKWERVGEEPNMYLRVLPFHFNTDKTKPELKELSITDDVNNMTNGVVRLPLLPDHP
ncbi:P-loop containing nucleoside triphosphate hydrolase protein [Dioscorea alata]|uniref:P-loop containing nucleoside triphosphate hydrolase protein n=3 Tax=Dioscorea alata TaxID=55571 RepID=A0ACB7UCU7_DIOAL|nr:P-loop containing nucleoside triphosphate hydrolase protein [Dioscorea alata]KAH7658113.1 P-loop containing nucleoside triphosphate hydrolase protein [Dioscorea alata]KAH7658114.1 P-loop containing nucleoside triphosphate hydrolase protein [Dioscorea alata]